MKSKEETELIWVTKDFATKYNKIESDEERYKVFEEYLKTVSDASRKEFRNNLDNLEEDVAIYTGLMLKVKQAFEKAKHEQLTASYELWENFEKELPSVNKKTKSMLKALEPLSKNLIEINRMLGLIKTYNIDDLIKTLEKFEALSGKSKEMFEFVVKHFNSEQKS